MSRRLDATVFIFQMPAGSDSTVLTPYAEEARAALYKLFDPALYTFSLESNDDSAWIHVRAKIHMGVELVSKMEFAVRGFLLGKGVQGYPSLFGKV